MKKLNYSLMTLCISNSFDTPEGFVDYAVKHGIKGIDWCTKACKGQKPEYIRHLCEDNGLTITDFIPFPQKLANREPDGWGELEQELELAAALGAPMTLIPTTHPGKNAPKMTRTELQEFWLEHLDKGAKLCLKLGITPLVESFAAGPGPFITADELIRVKKAIPELQFCYDAGNIATAGVDPIQEFKKLTAFAPVVYAHFKEMAVTDDTSCWQGMDGRHYVDVPFGEGFMDHAGIIDAMVEAGFTGWVNIESLSRFLEHDIDFLTK